jgi:hypothetical protein
MTEAVTAMCVKVALTAQAKEKVMNKEYWQRKADLCQKIGIEQLIAGDIPNGTRNLKRMVRALEEINLIKANEGEDKSAPICGLTLSPPALC